MRKPPWDGEAGRGDDKVSEMKVSNILRCARNGFRQPLGKAKGRKCAKSSRSPILAQWLKLTSPGLHDRREEDRRDAPNARLRKEVGLSKYLDPGSRSLTASGCAMALFAKGFMKSWRGR